LIEKTIRAIRREKMAKKKIEAVRRTARILGIALVFGLVLGCTPKNAGSGAGSSGGGGNKPAPAEDFVVDSSQEGSIRYSGSAKKVVIPSEINGDKITVLERYAFTGSAELTAVVIPEGVTTIEDFAFAQCPALTSVTLPASITVIQDGAFMNCPNLTTVNLPGKLERLGDYAFIGCKKLDGNTKTALAALGYERPF
jgi:hypothetical protein